MRNTIVVVGSINMDLMLRCPHLPQPGETVPGSDFRTAPGGKGANQALAAARLGGRVALVGCVGDDAFGSSALLNLQAAGVALAGVHAVPGCATGVAMVQVDDAGQNCIVVAPGANAHLAPAHVDAAHATLAQAAVLVCQLEVPLATVRHAVALARAAGVAVWLNPAPAQPLPATLLQQVDVLVVNAGEAAVLAGRPVASHADAVQAALHLRAAGCGAVLVTLGAGGVVWVDAQGVQQRSACKVVAVDTTGAGDTFIGALAASWVGAGATGATGTAGATGAPGALSAFGPAIDLAQRAAAFAVQRHGAQAAMPTAAQLPAL